MKKLLILFILLNIQTILSDDDHCEKWNWDLDDDTEWCVKCEDGYYLEGDDCHKSLCVEGEEEDSCLMCGKKDGKCYSCYSDDYSVYERYKCKKSFLMCGNNKISNCEKCEIVNSTETGICESCYPNYLMNNNTCYQIRNSIEIIKINKSIIYFMVLILLLNN